MGSELTYLASVDETAVRRFETAWRGGSLPDVADFLPPPGPKQATTLEELIHIDLEFRWKSAADGTRPPGVEQYLERFPELNEAAIVRRLVRQEIELRRRRGEALAAVEYAERFPGLDLDDSEFEAPVTATAPGRTRATSELRPGDTVGRYRLAIEHARGGFGLVWRAADDALGREVALKQLSDHLAGDRQTRGRFLTEARIAARL